MSEEKTINNTFIAQAGVVPLHPVLSSDGKLTFTLGAGDGRSLHEMGDCLLVVTEEAGAPRVNFHAQTEGGTTYHVYGDVEIFVNRERVGSSAWNSDIKKTKIDIAPQATIEYLQIDDGKVAVTQAGMPAGRTVKFTFSNLYCLRGDTGTEHAYNHPDPNIVIKVVNDPKTVAPEDYPTCEG